MLFLDIWVFDVNMLTYTCKYLWEETLFFLIIRFQIIFEWYEDINLVGHVIKDLIMRQPDLYIDIDTKFKMVSYLLYFNLKPIKTIVFSNSAVLLT